MKKKSDTARAWAMIGTLYDGPRKEETKDKVKKPVRSKHDRKSKAKSH
jgi:hypothetical protein